MQHHVVEVTPTINTAAYTADDQVGGIMTLAGAVPAVGDGAVLRQISVVDKAAQEAAITVLFFDELPTVASANNEAVNVADAQLADKCLGAVAIAAGDYVGLSAGSVATKQTALMVKANGSSSLYAVAFTTGTPTYGSASDLVFRFHFTWDA
jgi:hypothetical protein